MFLKYIDEKRVTSGTRERVLTGVRSANSKGFRSQSRLKGSVGGIITPLSLFIDVPFSQRIRLL